MQDTRRLLVFRETLISYRTKLHTTYLPNIQRNTFKEIFTILRDARRLPISLITFDCIKTYINFK